MTIPLKNSKLFTGFSRIGLYDRTAALKMKLHRIRHHITHVTSL